MKSKKVLIIIAALTFILTLANSVLMVFDAFMYSIDDIPEGEFVRAISKNDGTTEECSIAVYRVENSLGTGIRCTVTKKSDGIERNLYWQTGISDVTITSVDTARILIRAEGMEDLTLNVNIDAYDCRAIVEESIPVVEIVKSK